MKVSYLTSAEIAGSKQVTEVCGTIILFRKIIPDELNPESKLFLKPFKWVMDEASGKYKKKYLKIKDSKSEEQQPIERRRRRRIEDVSSETDSSLDDEYIDISKTYRLAFVDKAREGSDDKKVLLLELNGNTGEVSEKCWVDNVYTGQLSY